MKYIEAYLEKCLNNKGFHKKTSFIAGLVIGGIFFIVNIFSRVTIDVAVVTGIVTTIAFTIIWYIVIKRLHKSFIKQMAGGDVKVSISEREKKRENARRLMEERNSRRNKKKN